MIRRLLVRLNKDNDKIIGKTLGRRSYYCPERHSVENKTINNDILNIVNQRLNQQDKKICNLYCELESHKMVIKKCLDNMNRVTPEKKKNEIVFVKPDI